MTLNVTVITPRCMYQSADFRLLDWNTQALRDFETQKILLVNRFRWTASVCFAGVGRTSTVNVGDWLAEHVANVDYDAPFEALLAELQKADDWLSQIPAPNKGHTFSIGAFVGSKPVFALISNFEKVDTQPAQTVNGHLSLSLKYPTRPEVFVAGQRSVVSRPQRRRLAALASKHQDPELIFAALAELNRSAAAQNERISTACYTTYLDRAGRSGGAGQNISARAFMPLSDAPEIHKIVQQLIDERFGPGGGRLVQMRAARSEPTEDYHKTQLSENPNDAQVYSNYAFFLKENLKDIEGAERAYRKALEIDPKHVNALGNLANLMREKGNTNEANRLYRTALTILPQDEIVTYNYAEFLINDLHDLNSALPVLSAGIKSNQQSGRLLSLQGKVNLLRRNGNEALESFRQAREKNANQADVEAGIAQALHLSGAPIGTCIAAYHTAITLDSQNAALRLNLAQLLFLAGDDIEARTQLQRALSLGLDDSAQLEAQFYRLAHTSTEPQEILTAVSEKLAGGARLKWNVRPNIDRVRAVEPEKANLLENISRIMAGEESQSALKDIGLRWPSSIH